MAHSRTEWWLKHTGQVAHLPQDYSVIPKKLNYIGNFPDLTPPDKEFVMEIKENICPVYWKNVEENILEKYFLYNKKENVIYQNTMTGSAFF